MLLSQAAAVWVALGQSPISRPPSSPSIVWAEELGTQSTPGRSYLASTATSQSLVRDETKHIILPVPQLTHQFRINRSMECACCYFA